MMVIFPYLVQNTWVFNDDTAGLTQEPRSIKIQTGKPGRPRRRFSVLAEYQRL